MDYSFLCLWASLSWACIYLLLLARKRRSHAKLPPGPLPLPVVGSLFRLGDKPNESLARLANLHGPLMTLKLGRRTTVVVSSAKMAKEVLQKNDQVFAGRTVIDSVHALRHSESSMVWSQPNPYWRKLRMICNKHIFTTQRLDDSQHLRRQKVQELVDYVRENCGTGEAVDIGQAAFATILNLISSTVFSVDLVDFRSKSAQEYKDLVWKMMENAGTPNLSDYFPLLRFIDPQGLRRRMMKHLEELHATFDRMIDERSSPDYCRRNDFLDVLLDHSQEIDRLCIKALLVDLFGAGSDTSSTTVEWAMAELIRNPRIMTKARSEIMEAMGSRRLIEESDIARLPYLQAIVKETMRLHPPVPLLIPHRAESDVEIRGFCVPKHTQVLINAFSIGRDPEAWKDPGSFVPERFLNSGIDFRGQDFELIPFGAGRRICPGLPLAHRMVHLMLASLLHSFAWRLPEGNGPDEMDMNDKFGITLQKLVPLHVIPVQG